MNCTKCGSPLGENDRFCMICGTPAGVPAPQGGQPAPGPAAPQGYTPIVPESQQAQPQPQRMPYVQPVMQGANITIPAGRKYRIVCPDCGNVADAIKRDPSAGFPCTKCGKAYAYGGQLLIYRMGNGLPSAAIVPVAIYIDGVFYGEMANRDSVRIMLSTGTHIIGLGARPGTIMNKMQSNQFQITVTPELYNFAFKVSVVYRYMGPYGLELKQCSPAEIPDI